MVVWCKSLYERGRGLKYRALLGRPRSTPWIDWVGVGGGGTYTYE